MTTITVKLFGPQAQLAQRREVAVQCERDASCASDILAAVATACPALTPSIGHSRLAVNHELVAPDACVDAKDEVALIGMLGGG